MLTGRLDLSWPLRVAVAVLAAGSGVIHLVMVPSHMGEWVPEGAAFALAGWLQLAVAVWVLVRPDRAVLWVAVISSSAMVALWALARTAGLPLGPNAGTAQAAGTVDLTCVVLEMLLLAVAGLALARPDFGRDWDQRALVAATAMPVVVVVLTTSALASPSARDHAHARAGGETTDVALAADGHDHSQDGPSATPIGDDKGLSLLSNGHHHAMSYHPLDPATQSALDAQLAVTREVAAAFPTVAAAEAAGYRRAGPYSPGLGAHYTRANAAALNSEGVMSDEALRNPMGLLFTGNEPDDRIAGFMYYSSSAVEPVGFVGTNDTWHVHTSICLKIGPDGIDAPFGADRAATDEQCAQVNGMMLQTTQWMTHVWSVPGYENGPEGIFAEVNPALACSDGTYYQRPPERWIDNLLNTCSSIEASSPV
jgi:hypothetical protein